MPMTWNAEADARLFAAVLKVHSIKPDYAALALEMGPECTPKAVSHRFAHLKSKNGVSGGGSGGGSTPATPATPRKRNNGAKATPANTPAKRAAASKKKQPLHNNNNNDDDDDDDEEESEGKLSIEPKIKPDPDASTAPRVSPRSTRRPRGNHGQLASSADADDEVSIVDRPPKRRARATSTAAPADLKLDASPLAMATQAVFGGTSEEDQMRLELDGSGIGEGFSF
ncbi:MAG: hypothetical protein M1821_006885 [Bathelium mastoideum]|nr:MAG: hypothetical protein M1821_006885 [Bathelium mastoideum]KAI9676299.1 MAG: hypothetical protein M1822_008333 [Bathelium mastoideum]